MICATGLTSTREQPLITVDAALAAHLARMTPMLADVGLSALDLGGVTEITIDMNLYAGMPGALQTEEQA